MTTSEFKPSWMKWPPNSCEVCTAWKREGEWHGVCQRASSVNFEQPTDARQRCPEYQREPDA